MKIRKLLDLLAIDFDMVEFTLSNEPDADLKDNLGVYIYCIKGEVKYIGDSIKLRSRIRVETKGPFDFGATKIKDSKNLASTNIRLNARFHVEKPGGNIQLYFYSKEPSQSEKILNCKLVSKAGEEEVHIKFGERNIAVITKDELAMISPKSRLELEWEKHSEMTFERVLLMLHILQSESKSLPPWNLTF